MDDKSRRRTIAIAAVVVLAIIMIALIVWAIIRYDKSTSMEQYSSGRPYRFWYQYHPWYGRRRNYGYGLPLHQAGPLSKYYWYYRYPYYTYGSSYNPYSTW